MTHRVRPIEWMLYAGAAVVVVGTVGGALALDLAGPEDAHPRIVARVDGEPWTDDDKLAVPWVVENVSSWDVEQVQIEIGAVDAEPVSQEVDYLPRGSSRRGVARVDPGGEARVDVAGYRLP